MITLDASSPCSMVYQVATQRVNEPKICGTEQTILYANPQLGEHTLTFKPIPSTDHPHTDALKTDIWSNDLMTFAEITFNHQHHELGMFGAIRASFNVLKGMMETLGPTGIQFDGATLEAFAMHLDEALAANQNLLSSRSHPHSPDEYPAFKNSKPAVQHRRNRPLSSLL